MCLFLRSDGDGTRERRKPDVPLPPKWEWSKGDWKVEMEGRVGKDIDKEVGRWGGVVSYDLVVVWC